MKLIGKLISTIALLGGWLILSFQLYLGITTGEFITRHRKVVYEEDPLTFIFGFGFALFMNIIILLIIGSIAYFAIDKKVGAYGGTYNINTFKAIMRGWLK